MAPSASEQPSPFELAEALRPALLRLSRRLRREALIEGFTPAQMILLGKIHSSPGIGVCELADEERISRPAMSGRVKQLVDAGLIARSADLADARRSGLSVTAEGRKKLDAVRRRRNDWLAAQLSSLTAQDRSRIALALSPLLRLVEAGG